MSIVTAVIVKVIRKDIRVVSMATNEYIKPKYDKWCLEGKHILSCEDMVLVPEKKYPICFCIACEEYYEATPEFIERIDKGW